VLIAAALPTPARAASRCPTPMPCCAKGACARTAHASARWSRCHEDGGAVRPATSWPPAVFDAATAHLPAPAGNESRHGIADAHRAAHARAPETPPPDTHTGHAVSVRPT